MKLRTTASLFFGALAILGAAMHSRDQSANAHTLTLPVAVLSNPEGTGTVADTSFTFHWFDSDRAVSTGTATIEIYYTSQIPPTFSQGVIPETLTGTVVVKGILETDPANSYTWDTTNVPSGTYWLYSIVNEPPGEIGTSTIVTFSPGVVTIHHPNDPVHPAVVITKPDSPFRWADSSFEIGYSAFDPHGTGRVKLEAWAERDMSDLRVLADNLPALPDGKFLWDTKDLEEEDFILRATITDARGMSFVAHGRFFLLITHIPVPDAGPEDTGEEEPDAGTPADSGKGPAKSAPGGCTCTTGQVPSGAVLALLPLMALLLRRRRS